MQSNSFRITFLKRAYYVFLFFLASGFSYIAFANPPGSPYAPGATLDPGCTPGSANCTVSILPSGSDGQIQFNSSGSLGGNTVFVWDNTNNRLGIGTSTPYAPLSVAGEVVASYFTATTTATSTFTGGLNVKALNVTSSSATSTFSNGISLSSGCFSVNGACLGGSSLSGSGVANTLAYWTGGSALSYNNNFVWDNTNGRLGIGTSSPYSMLSVAGQIVGQNFVATSTTATSTFAGNINLINSSSSFGTGGGQLSSSIASTTQYRFLSVNTDSTNGGPRVIDFYDALFNGTRDPGFHWGYNQSGGGTAIISGEPGLIWGVEGNYNDGSGQNKMESYLQYLSSTSTPIRPIFFSINRSTNYIQNILKGNLIRFNDNDGTNEAGTALFDFSRNNIVMYGPDTSQPTTFQIRAPAGQPAILSLGRNGVNNYNQLYSEASSSLSIFNNSQRVGKFYSSVIGGSGSSFAVGADDNTAIGVFDVGTSPAGSKGLITRGRSGQTGNLFEAQNSASIPLVVITPSGNVGIGTTSPYSMLSVAGQIVGQNFVATSTTATTTLLGGLAVGSSGSALTVLQNGNVGIGINNPSYPVEMRTPTGYGFIHSNAFNQSFGTYLGSTGGQFGTISNDDLWFFVNSGGFDPGSQGALKMVIKSPSGNVGVGTSSPYAKFTVWGSGTGSNTLANFVNNASTTVFTALESGNIGIGTTSPWRTLSVAGTVAMNGLTTSVTGNAVCITTTKEITDAGAASCVPSSIRFKENISELPMGTALNELKKMTVKTFTYKKEYQMDDQEHIGLIAEDLETIDPRLVVYNKSDGKPWSIHFEELTGLLVQSTKELDARTTALEANASAIHESTSGWSIDASGKLVVDELEVHGNAKIGSPGRRSGVTLYDEQTGTPYCLTISDGVTKTTSGECGTTLQPQVQTSPPPPTLTVEPVEQADTSDATSTPILVPQSPSDISTTTPEETLPPSTDATSSQATSTLN